MSSCTDETKQRGSIQAEGYRNWLSERKKLRHDLNSCGLNKVWLSRKAGRTELENRVLIRMREKKIKTGRRNKQVVSRIYVFIMHLDANKDKDSDMMIMIILMMIMMIMIIIR